MINATEHYDTYFKEFKTSATERIDIIEILILENVTQQEIVKTKDMKQQMELLQNENNRVKIETEYLLKVI